MAEKTFAFMVDQTNWALIIDENTREIVSLIVGCNVIPLEHVKRKLEDMRSTVPGWDYG